MAKLKPSDLISDPGSGSESYSYTLFIKVTSSNVNISIYVCKKVKEPKAWQFDKMCIDGAACVGVLKTRLTFTYAA